MKDGEYSESLADGSSLSNCYINSFLVDGSYYFYAPNKGAAISLAVAFCASGVVHGWQASYVTIGSRSTPSTDETPKAITSAGC